MPLFKKPKGTPDDAPNPPQRDLEREAAAQLEATRREAAERLSGSRVNPAPPPSAAPPPAAPSGADRPPRAPAAPASFGTPPSSGGAATPSDERRAITDMALEDLQSRESRRQESGGRTQYLAQPARAAADELERRRPPAPGETLPGVPPPHIPSEDLRDQALREILERKERLDREYQERQAKAGGGQAPGAAGAGAAAPAARPKRKTRLHAVAEKRKQLLEAKEAGSATESVPAKAPIRKRAVAKPAPEPEPASATTTTGESVEDALAGVKGVGPVIRSALLERFDSVEAIREADADKLTEVEGIGPALASRIKTSL